MASNNEQDQNIMLQLFQLYKEGKLPNFNPNNPDDLNRIIEKSTKFIYESVKNGRFGTLNPNFNSNLDII